MTQNNAPKWHSLVTGTAGQIAALKSEARLTVVSAGAGTGKTQTLSQRFAWLLASDPSCGAGEILVLTFTKKAAAEMLGRIKETLAAWHNAYPDELAHLGERIEHMDDAYISTIHAFAMKLIRESGLALDIDPAAAIMPAPKEEIWWQEFAAALSSASFAKISAALPEEWRARAGELFRSPDFVDALNALTPEAFADAARSCAEKLYCAGQSADELWRCDGSALEASAASMAPLRAEIYELWMGEIFPALASEGLLDCGKKANDTQRRLADFREKWTARAVGPDDGEALAEFCKGLFDEALKPAPRGKIKTAVEALLGRPLTEWRGETQEALALLEPPSEAEKRINGLLCKACAVGWACWDEFRRREGLLSISDLIYYASKVVRSSPEYRTKFKHIMVDEFQDTDPLQNELIESLWGGGEGGATLFVVGDQKQSIYRFRHADLGLFRDYTARALNNPEAAKYIVLDQNFRTAKGLLEKFNGLFGEMWGGADSPVLYERLAAPENDEASARRDGAEVPYPRFEALRAFAPYVEDKGARPDSAALRLRLYAGLGRKFAAMVEAQAPVWDKRAKIFRPVRWRDFAVLVQTRAEYSDIERAFERIGLPYVLSTSKDYFGRGETGDLVNLVSLLASPDDPLFLAGWLASPFSGVESAEAEALIEAALEKRERGSALPLAEAVTRARPDVMARLDEMRRRALLGGVSEVLLGLLKTPQFLENYAGMRRLRVNANVVYLANIAAEYERSEGKSLRGCAEYLLTASSSGSAKEEPELFGDDVDAVRVMTVHASKGLEFPVVAMTLSDKKGASLPSIIVSKKYGAAAKDYPEYLEGAGEARGDGRTAAYRWERHDENAAQREELERLWYVGFTRARDRLILCGIYKEPKKAESAKPNFLGSIIESGLCDEYTDLDEDDKSVPKYAEYAAPAEGAKLGLKVVSPAKLGRISASAYALLSWCPAAYRMIYRQGRDADWIIKGGGGGADFGVMAHWLLARWDFRAESLDLLLPRARGLEWRAVSWRMPAELRIQYRSDAKRAELRAMLERFAATAECARLAALAGEEGALQRETRFRVPLNGTVLIGATDLFWRDADGLHLRDWKSAPEETAPSFYYEKQLEFYACALNRCLAAHGGAGTPIDSALIYLRSDGTGGVRGYDAEDFAKIEEEIENAAIRAVSGDFGGAAERCARCPWRADCMEKSKAL